MKLSPKHTPTEGMTCDDAWARNDFSDVRPPKTFDPAGLYEKPEARTCRWCGAPVAKYRRDYCSNACQTSRLAYTSWAWTRRYVFWRDHGSCRLCALDCGLVERVRLRLQKLRPPAKPRHPSPHAPMFRTREEAFERRRLEMWFEDVMGIKKGTACWEVDHILPRRSGGHDQPPNLRLLCQACHRDVTAEYAGLLAAGRKTMPQLGLPLREPSKWKRVIPSRPFGKRNGAIPSRPLPKGRKLRGR